MTSHHEGRATASAVALLVVLVALLNLSRPKWVRRFGEWLTGDTGKPVFLTVGFAGEEITTVDVGNLFYDARRTGYVSVATAGIMPDEMITVVAFTK